MSYRPKALAAEKRQLGLGQVEGLEGHLALRAFVRYPLALGGAHGEPAAGDEVEADGDAVAEFFVVGFWNTKGLAGRGQGL
jgi:hypothetical protein